MLLKWLNKLLRVFKIPRHEYVYVFTLDTATIAIKGGVQGGKIKYDSTLDANQSEQIRAQLISEVNRDLMRMGKEIKFSDFLVDSKEYKTTYVLASDSINTNVYFTPVMYEVYAFHKIKQKDIFTYKVEELSFKISKNDLKVLKIKVKC